MSTVRATNFQNASSASTNITLDTAGNATVAGTMAMASSFLRNRIINGDMRIDQRNAGASVGTGSGSIVYTVDRWAANYSQVSKYTIQQNSGAVTPPAGYTHYLGAVSSSAYSVLTGDFFMLNQRIEGFNVGDLGWGAAGAQSVTLSFWVRSSLTGTFGGAFTNSAQNRSYPFTYTISAANTWEQKTVTVAGDTSGTWLKDSGIGLWVNFSLGTGATYSGTAGAWAAANYYSATGAVSVVGTNAATWYVTGVQLEAGSAATPFERRQYGTELALCQRYCVSCNNLAVVGQAYGTTTGTVFVALPTSMRTAPVLSTTTGYNATNTTGGNVSVTPSLSNYYSPNMVRIDITAASGLTAGQASIMFFPATVNMSAEL